MDGYEEVALRKLKGPRQVTEWYTILIIAGKEAEIQSKANLVSGCVISRHNSNTVPGSY